MKIRNLLFIACLTSISFAVLANAPVVARASGRHHASTREELHKKPPVYDMVRRSIVGTDNAVNEQVWDVQIAAMIPPQVTVNSQPPNYLFKSLDAPLLLIWVGSLPPKSEITFDISTGPRVKSADPSESSSGKPPAKMQQEIDAFAQFCAEHNVAVIELVSSG